MEYRPDPLADAEARMDKAIEHLHSELRGIRTGRASTALVDYVKVDYYGSMTDLKALASVSIPEATQILIKPFDAGALQEIRKALESSDLGLNPQIDDKQIRINILPLPPQTAASNSSATRRRSPKTPRSRQRQPRCQQKPPTPSKTTSP